MDLVLQDSQEMELLVVRRFVVQTVLVLQESFVVRPVNHQDFVVDLVQQG